MALIRIGNAPIISSNIFDAEAIAKSTIAANSGSISFTSDDITDGSYLITTASTDTTTLGDTLNDYRTTILNYSWLVHIEGTTITSSTDGQVTPPTLSISGNTLSGDVGQSSWARYATLFKIG